MTTPRVSILIPNYNNGRESSLDGRRDLIGDLLQSLHDTLKDEPTPFEIIAYDDGSTDDSLATLRDWANRSFLDLIEEEHCGVLAKTANVLSRKARGDILARLDGDTICLTENWVSKLCEWFDNGEEKLGVVGPKQLRPNLTIHAYGDFVLHPNGYTHVASGMDRNAVKHPMEVDHVMGCFYCCRKAVYEDVGGYDETFLRGQTVDLGMLSRLNGWKCIAVPNIEFIHAHGQRQGRPIEADTPAGIERSLKVFEDKWGFSRIAPDLDFVRQRYAGSPLLWNKMWFGEEEPLSLEFRDRRVSVEQSGWAQYADDAVVQQQINFRAGVILQVIQQTGRPQRLVQIGCGDGLLLHLLATQGIAGVGVDRRGGMLDLARQCVTRHEYQGDAPQFLHQEDPRRLPLQDGSADLVCIADFMERHPNPVGLLREAYRVAADGKPVLIISPRQSTHGPDPSDPQQIEAEAQNRRLSWTELINIARGAGGFGLMMDPKQDDPARDMVLLLQKLPDAASGETKVA